MPLYTVTCGDLGVSHASVEGTLREVFDKVTRWNAVLLLDEADVFLQERSIRQLERNALVSVFLRELEYFDGIMFLTTNRPGHIDEAFQSRIHVVLSMPPLEFEQQLKIWSIFLRDQMDTKQQAKKLADKIAQHTKADKLNGRQIRNTVRTALALAAHQNTPLSLTHLEQVAKLNRAFASYMVEVNDANDETRQRMLGNRVVPAWRLES
ncbi:P-loop containing nucleoside triphosphate hydrolase protein [Microthyrium microscopicum]|uniref:P-loop containing nucleoside triphosphate hydrolase protein n=1 Tax=Microthyrium microscopicum TaxID=703497 RepID=A0A6A6U525_9PEZI|nr:P-loop containing nucleoside triphosphate hydrolase protein [Microthyrium microscopicum]